MLIDDTDAAAWRADHPRTVLRSGDRTHGTRPAEHDEHPAAPGRHRA